MGKLSYRTRGDSSPQGKSRVYFASHPQDFLLYFDTLADDILKCQNCTIWYDEEPVAEYDMEAMQSDLAQMQLFVFPVTTRFLYQKNRAREVDFRRDVKIISVSGKR